MSTPDPMSVERTAYELADFDPTTGHLHTCMAEGDPEAGCVHECAGHLYAIAEDELTNHETGWETSE